MGGNGREWERERAGGALGDAQRRQELLRHRGIQASGVLRAERYGILVVLLHLLFQRACLPFTSRMSSVPVRRGGALWCEVLPSVFNMSVCEHVFDGIGPNRATQQHIVSNGNNCSNCSNSSNSSNSSSIGSGESNSKSKNDSNDTKNTAAATTAATATSAAATAKVRPISLLRLSLLRLLDSNFPGNPLWA